MPDAGSILAEVPLGEKVSKSPKVQYLITFLWKFWLTAKFPNLTPLDMHVKSMPLLLEQFSNIKQWKMVHKRAQSEKWRVAKPQSNTLFKQQLLHVLYDYCQYVCRCTLAINCHRIGLSSIVLTEVYLATLNAILVVFGTYDGRSLFFAYRLKIVAISWVRICFAYLIVFYSLSPKIHPSGRFNRSSLRKATLFVHCKFCNINLHICQ